MSSEPAPAAAVTMQTRGAVLRHGAGSGFAQPNQRLGVLETDRHHAAALGKLRHDLLVQPDVHFRRAIESSSVAELLRQLLAGAKAAVELEQLHEIDDRYFQSYSSSCASAIFLIMSSTWSCVSGLPVIPGAPEAVPLAAEAGDTAAGVVAAALPCLKIADTILPKMLIWVKHRPIGIAPQPAQSSLVFPSPVTNSFASHIGST